MGLVAFLRTITDGSAEAQFSSEGQRDHGRCNMSNSGDIPGEVRRHYETNNEAERLTHGDGRLEEARVHELLDRYLPAPPAAVLDVGGGPGRYSGWLASRGYEAHLIDPVPGLLEHAREIDQSDMIASITVGEARTLEWPNNSVDAVLLFGPLYHLVERSERVRALTEARRVTKPGGKVLAMGISRFASAFDGLFRCLLDDPDFEKIVDRDLLDGQHRNPPNSERYFTTAFFHHPNELRSEVEDSGLLHQHLIAVEGPGWLLQSLDEHWENEGRRERLLKIVRKIEGEVSLMGVSSHFVAVATKRSD